MAHFIEQQREREHGAPSSLHLRWLGCPAAGECWTARWWTTVKRYSAAERRKRRETIFILDLPSFTSHLHFINSIHWGLKAWNCCYNFLFGNMWKDRNKRMNRFKRKQKDVLKLEWTVNTLWKLLEKKNSKRSSLLHIERKQNVCLKSKGA